MRTFPCALVFLALLAFLSLPAMAAKKAAPTDPGRYTDWGEEIDVLEIKESFKLADYTKVVVEPFDTADTPLPEKDDNTYEPVRLVLQEPARPFTQGLSEEIGGKIQVSEGSAAEGETLIVRTRLVTMDPGSRAARYWASFGAGAARTEISGEVVEGASGKVLLHFTQERRSGFGVGGGDYVKLMQRTLRQLGGDVALILNAF